MEFKDLIKTRRLMLNKTLEEIGRTVGVSKATVQRWESGDIKNIRRDKIAKLAAALETTPDCIIMGWEPEYSPAIGAVEEDNTTYIRFLGEVAAGYGHVANEEFEYLKVPVDWLKGRPNDDYFALRVSGSSMYPMYCDGDEIMCLKANDMGGSGKVGVLIYGEEATLKKLEYVMGEDWLDLVPINPEYETKRIEGAELEKCRVIGIPVKLIRTYNAI